LGRPGRFTQSCHWGRAMHKLHGMITKLACQWDLKPYFFPFVYSETPASETNSHASSLPQPAKPSGDRNRGFLLRGGGAAVAVERYRKPPRWARSSFCDSRNWRSDALRRASSRVITLMGLGAPPPSSRGNSRPRCIHTSQVAHFGVGILLSAGVSHRSSRSDRRRAPPHQKCKNVPRDA
jgi:hypothetical protein